MVGVYVLAEIRLYRDGLARILARVPGLQVLGAAADYDRAREELDRLRPQIVLLDTVMPGSLGVARTILARPQPPKIVALGVPDAEDELLACAEAGISGYVTRDDSIETMVDVIDSVSRGELLTTPRIAAVLLERVGALAASARAPERHRLTPREREIVELLAEGLANKAIAARLGISDQTVKFHVAAIYGKLGAANRTDAVRRAVRRGLISL